MHKDVRVFVHATMMVTIITQTYFELSELLSGRSVRNWQENTVQQSKQESNNYCSRTPPTFAGPNSKPAAADIADSLLFRKRRREDADIAKRGACLLFQQQDTLKKK